MTPSEPVTLTRLRELEGRLEKAKGADFEINELLMDVAGYTSDIVTDGVIGPERIWRKPGITTGSPGRFTSSIDAALALVPEGFTFYVDGGEICDFTRGNPHACVYTKRADLPQISGGAKDCVSPALALCLACIRARIALQEQGAK
jgi:hypothetical protein